MKKKNPTLVEALAASIAKEKAKFPEGVIVARKHADRYADLGLEAHPEQKIHQVRSMDPNTWRLHKQRLSGTAYFVVIDSYWDADYCFLWVELLGLGDPNVRGWLRSPETKLMHVDMEKKRSRPCKTR